MPEASTRVAALLSGQVDWVEAPPPDAIDRLKSAGMTIVTNVYPHTWPYLLNYQRGPFKDFRVRRAANYAVNRDEMVEMLNGVAVPSYRRLSCRARGFTAIRSNTSSIRRRRPNS